MCTTFLQINRNDQSILPCFTLFTEQFSLMSLLFPLKIISYSFKFTYIVCIRLDGDDEKIGFVRTFRNTISKVVYIILSVSVETCSKPGKYSAR